MAKNFLQILDCPQNDIFQLLERTKEIKLNRECSNILKNKSILLLFEKASTRTRLSFEVAIRELGGCSIFMSFAESQLGRKEPLKDTALVLNRYVQGLVVRTFAQENLEELARYSQIPVINALTDKYHPCQVLSDLFTIYERTPDFSQIKIVWVGDGNNMAQSWINAARYFPFTLELAIPEGYEPEKEVLDSAWQNGAKITMSYDPYKAVKGAHYINTDVWASMGQEETEDKRIRHFQAFQVNEDLLKEASSEVLVMHCLPAHRGQEITSEVLDGPKSIVWDQAENRLHMQKALLEWINQ